MAKTLNARTFMVLTLAPLIALSIGCGRETKVYPDPVVATTDADPIIVVDGRSVLPQDFYDQSVNGGFADLALDGTTSTSLALRLGTLPAANLEGGFNGAGSGNRAILGIGGHHTRRLDQVTSLTFDAKSYAGGEMAAFILQLDLSCDGTGLKTVIAEATDLATANATAPAPTAGYTRFTAAVNAAVWSAPDAAILDSGAQVLVPDSASNALASLSALLVAYPNACLRNGFANAAALPRGIPTAAVMLALGGPGTTEMNGVFINRITVGDSVYSGME